MKTELVRARVDAQLKHGVEDILGSLGLSTSAAITLFYKQILLNRGLPFPVVLPNAATRQAIEDAVSGRDLASFDSPTQLLAALKESACVSTTPSASARTTPEP